MGKKISRRDWYSTHEDTSARIYDGRFLAETRDPVERGGTIG